ncbi:MAG TPA: response regulator [Candidatus Saccharimonadia bacterium]|nr:response regulator [Candidatus Saccharimonadia bacterium]
METTPLGAELAALAQDTLHTYAVVLLDPDGVIVGWNRGAARMLGYAPGEVLGRHFSLMFIAADVEAGKPGHELREAVSAGCAADDNWLLRKDGSRFFASGISEPLHADGLRGFVKIVRDVTDRRRIDDESRRRLQELADSDRHKDSFLAMRSHEPRELPAVETPVRELEPAAPAAESVAPGAVTVMVVDDNVDGADSIAMLLRILGYIVHVAYEGNAALGLAASVRPDLVLLDIGLPGIDGYAVAARLRAQQSSSRMLLVAMTGYGTDADRARTRDAGFDAHLVKPVEPRVLEALLADVGRRLVG